MFIIDTLTANDCAAFFRRSESFSRPSPFWRLPWVRWDRGRLCRQPGRCGPWTASCRNSNLARCTLFAVCSSRRTTSLFASSPVLSWPCPPSLSLSWECHYTSRISVAGRCSALRFYIDAFRTSLPGCKPCTLKSFLLAFRRIHRKNSFPSRILMRILVLSGFPTVCLSMTFKKPLSVQMGRAIPTRPCLQNRFSVVRDFDPATR